jgi:hypothetical protein
VTGTVLMGCIETDDETAAVDCGLSSSDVKAAAQKVKSRFRPPVRA